MKTPRQSRGSKRHWTSTRTQALAIEIRPICSEAEHAWALGEIERLWAKAEPGTPEGERFEVLSTLIDANERQHVPVPPPGAVEAIDFRRDQEGLRRKELSE